MTKKLQSLEKKFHSHRLKLSKLQLGLKSNSELTLVSILLNTINLFKEKEGKETS